MPATATKNWLQNTSMYQIHLGRWQSASILNHRNQVLNKLIKHNFKNLADHGVGIIYLLGLFDNRAPIIVNQENGQDISNQPNRLPSPFALVDHTKANLYLGKSRDVKYLIKSLHKKGFKIIVDFVPNHTGHYHPWVKLHPDYYVQNYGHKVAEFSGDVYKLNYQNQELRGEMIDTLKTIAGWDVDGVRCDMAHLVPNDFWSEAINQVKQDFPEFKFVAEAYSDTIFDLSVLTGLMDSGFDAVYHEPLYRNLVNLIKDNHPIDHIVGHLKYIINQPFAAQMVNYFANHDDPIPQHDPRFIEALLALTQFLPGISFIYNGTLNGLTSRLAHHYYQDLPVSKLELNYISPVLKRILDLKQEHQPEIQNVDNINGNILLEGKTKDGQAFKLLVNLTNQDQGFSISTESVGLIHEIDASSHIHPGQAEIFIN